MKRMICRLVLVGIIASLSTQVAAQGFGSFVGEVIAEWLPDGRRMQLAVDFAYLDRAGKRWNAPKGSIVDGASIPRIFWTVVGGPFEGQYRRASVVHDVACVTRSEPWQDVHRMFYYAMRAGGVSDVRAGVMYAAVYRFGPRWDKPRGFWGTLSGKLGDVFGVGGEDASVAPPPAPPAPLKEEDVKALEALIEQNRPTTPEDIERLLAS